jgi:hypothetical protein
MGVHRRMVNGFSALVVCGAWATPMPVGAQTEPGASPSPAPDAAPAPSIPQAPVSVAASVPLAPAQPLVCVPACRAGFTCANGACVSSCNPACGAGETCTARGECLTREEQRYTATVRRHDGFYLRLELGFGGLFGSRTERDSFDGLQLDGSVSGLAQVGALMMGGTLAPGIVLGGGAWGVNAPAASYHGDVRTDAGLTNSRVAADQRVDVDLASLSIIGPFVSWYPDPARGLHAEVALGVALATIGDASELRGGEVLTVWDYSDNGGVGTVLSGGYDFWVGEQWSLGLFGRVSYAYVVTSKETNTLSAWSPAFGVAVTYH